MTIHSGFITTLHDEIMTTVAHTGDDMMGRFFVFIYGLVAYLIGLDGLFWFTLFIGGWNFLPFHIDSGVPGSLASALLINVSLILLFGVQHSVMARPYFKNQFNRIFPQAAERSTFVLVSGIIMGLICLFWQPMDGMLWHTDNGILKAILIGGYVAGWGMAVASTFVINHFDLFGLRQVYYHLINKPEPEPYFVERLFYKVVRHPLQAGILIGIWSAPSMSMTHFMLSALMSVYIFIGLYFEEKDLVATLGDRYVDYQKRVRMVIPVPK